MNHDAHVKEYYASRARWHYAHAVTAIFRERKDHAEHHKRRSEFWFRQASPIYDSQPRQESV